MASAFEPLSPANLMRSRAIKPRESMADIMTEQSIELISCASRRFAAQGNDFGPALFSIFRFQKRIVAKPPFSLRSQTEALIRLGRSNSWMQPGCKPFGCLPFLDLSVIAIQTSLVLGRARECPAAARSGSNRAFDGIPRSADLPKRAHPRPLKRNFGQQPEPVRRNR